ncbi:hypothetical protein EHS25_003523 [Saitozyma podzolica]|uniref:Uncharacterized protein n=1 Tax=Saitozyma podzolica TaxID=1890683 RepID=A0A427Y7H4_9TREE|nr:hypothetical protein EHS25_003523 [Saitozyma podzolica]
MQNVLDTAKSVASTAATHASNLASTAAEYAGLTHTHGDEHAHRSTLPPDATAGEVKKMDAEGLAVFEGKEVRHECLVKINQLALDDKKHGLKELASLDLVTEGGQRGIDFYHPQRYFTVHRPMGTDYIGEVEIEEGKCIHIRCHKANGASHATFHSIDTRPGSEGGAVFTKGERLGWFDY